MRALITIIAIFVMGVASAQTQNYGPFEGNSFSITERASSNVILGVNEINYNPIDRSSLAFQSIRTADEWRFALGLQLGQYAESYVASVTSVAQYQITIDFGNDFDEDPSAFQVYKQVNGLVSEAAPPVFDGFMLTPPSFPSRFQIIQFEHGSEHGLSVGDVISIIPID